jgi:hypothetical protein
VQAALVQLFAQVIKDTTGANEVEIVQTGDKYFEFGYIDHQSDHVPADALKDAQVLKAFIFDPASVLHTDNDNHYDE